MSNLGLLAAQVLSKAGSRDWLLAEPEELLSKAEGAAVVVSTMFVNRERT